MSPPSAVRIKYVSPNTIRRLFNRSQYPAMIANGRLIAEQPYLRNDHLKDPGTRGEPYCTRGQMIRYLNRLGQWVVEVFQYLRPDNTIGGSGSPDPKRLRIRNTIYIVEI